MLQKTRIDITGPARVGKNTKQLLRRLIPGDIAVLSHPDMDRLAAVGLIRGGARAVLNTAPSMTGRFPSSGPRTLIAGGMVIIDDLGSTFMDRVSDGQEISVRGEEIISGGEIIGRGRRLTRTMVGREEERAARNLDREMDRFVDNTLAFARREKNLILEDPPMPPLKARVAGRHVVVVIRGDEFERDLDAILGYIRHQRPLLVGVDGGADALLGRGLKPDLIIGDMDSASDRALRSGAELVVQAYGDGRVPGMDRLEAMGLRAHAWQVPGTSEDAALLLAHAGGANLIVAVGTHTHVLDFLEKGRAGMASTFLTRLRVGRKLVDARGVGHLYRYGPGPHHWLALAVAGLLPVMVLVLASPLFMSWFRLLSLKFQLLWGW